MPSTHVSYSTSRRTICVVIVCRNARPLLKKTLLNIGELNDPHLQTIVIDAQSTDGTQELLDSWRDKLLYFSSEPDSGIYDAMNKGWRAAPENSYILFLGAGDYVLELPKTEDMIGASGTFPFVIMGDCIMGQTLFTSRWDGRMRFYNTAHHQSLLIHKSIHPDPPFNDSLRIFADWDFNLRLFRSGIRAKRVESFRSFAEPGGVSAQPDLAEVRRVAQYHSGAWAGWVAWIRYKAFLLWRKIRRLA